MHWVGDSLKCRLERVDFHLIGCGSSCCFPLTLPNTKDAIRPRVAWLRQMYAHLIVVHEYIP